VSVVGDAQAADVSGAICACRRCGP
jgi:hypothetical protein